MRKDVAWSATESSVVGVSEAKLRAKSTHVGRAEKIAEDR